MFCRNLAKRIMESTTAPDAYGRLESFLGGVISEGIALDNPEDWENKIGVKREAFIDHMLKLSDGTKQNPAIVNPNVMTAGALKLLQEINAEIPGYLTNHLASSPTAKRKKPVGTGSTAGVSKAFNFVSLSGEPLSEQPDDPIVVEVPILPAVQTEVNVYLPNRGLAREPAIIYGMPDEYTDRVHEIIEAFPERIVVLVFRKASWDGTWTLANGVSIMSLTRDGLSPKDIGQRLIGGQSGTDGVRVIDPAKSVSHPIPIISNNATPEQYLDRVPVTMTDRWRRMSLGVEFDTSLLVRDEKPAGRAIAGFGCFGVVVRPKALG